MFNQYAVNWIKYGKLIWLTLRHSTFTPISLNQSEIWYLLQAKKQTKPKKGKCSVEYAHKKLIQKLLYLLVRL